MDFGWKADGIDRARAAGGIDLDTYRRPGFQGGKALRRASQGGGGGIYLDDPEEPDPFPYMKKTYAPDPKPAPKKKGKK